VKLGIVRNAAADEFEARDDRHQQVVEIMGDTARQLTDGFEFLRLEQRLAGSIEFLRGFALFGHITGDLCKADQLSMVVQNAIDENVRPETGAVLTHTPALAFHPADGRGQAEVLLWLSVFAVFLRVKAGEMLTYNFVERVALDPLGPGIPAGDMAGGIKHVDGVIRHALNQDLELGLVVAQDFLRCSSLGQVARYFGKPDEFAGVVPDRVNQYMRPEPRSIFADSPSFTFKPAVLHGTFERQAGYICGPIFVRVKPAEVRSNDFFSFVALETLCPEIPADYVTLCVEHIDSVVDDGLYQQAVVTFERDGHGLTQQFWDIPRTYRPTSGLRPFVNLATRG